MDPAETDYPAAHSMDTTWFGVDDEGEIAIFDTGENGAVPKAANTCDGSNLFYENFLTVFPKNAMGYYLHPIDASEYKPFLDPASVDKLPDHDPAHQSWDNLLVQFNSIEDIPTVSPRYEEDMPPVLFTGHDCVLVFFPGVEKYQLIERYKRGAILSFRPLNDMTESLQAIINAQGLNEETFLSAIPAFRRNDLLASSPPPEDWIYTYLGAHYYDCDEATTIYEAQCRPAVAMNIANLQAPNPEDFNFVRLKGVTFANASAIQPFAFEDCISYGSREYWAAVDGTFHRVNGTDGKPQVYDDSVREELGVRPVGVPRVDIDYDDWPD